jgi:tRNA pseudouridine55 synthase
MNLLTNKILRSQDDFTDWQTKIQEEGGLILINKDEGWTSFDIVRKIKYLFKIKKVGHAGTLDPLASGLVIVAIGKATKLLSKLQNDDKQYVGFIKLGVTTPSFDRETEEEDECDISHIKDSDITSNMPNFLGEIEQFPPVYSAVKYNGKRAYEFARKKIDISLESRKVIVSSFIIENIDYPYLKFKIDVSKGFYVRSFAYDFGKRLNVPSYLYSLQRTRVGEFYLDDALNIEEIESFLNDLSKSL